MTVDNELKVTSKAVTYFRRQPEAQIVFPAVFLWLLICILAVYNLSLSEDKVCQGISKEQFLKLRRSICG